VLLSWAAPTRIYRPGVSCWPPNRMSGYFPRRGICHPRSEFHGVGLPSPLQDSFNFIQHAQVETEERLISLSRDPSSLGRSEAFGEF
jgi:hypothetical protein